jgi:microfibrillar-associated protein 1
MPAVLQVKNFGKRGRTKYTHLMDQDTTKFNERLQVDEKLQQKYLQQVGGVGSLDYAGKLYKRPKHDEYSH